MQNKFSHEALKLNLNTPLIYTAISKFNMKLQILNKKKILIFILYFINVSCFGESLNQRNLAIVLDLVYQDINETEYTFASAPLNALIKSKKTPILTTYSALENYLIFTSNYNILNSTEWEIFQKGSFVLLIPQEYKNLHSALGFNLLDFHTIKVKKPLWSKINKLYDFIYSELHPFILDFNSKKFLNLLKNLIIPKELCPNIQWNIYLSGHGSSDFVTAGIKDDSFKNLLLYLEHDINTHLFYYLTCSSGGKKIDRIYTNDNKPQKYTYPIFNSSFTEAFVWANSEFDFVSLFNIFNQVDNAKPETLNEVAKLSYNQQWKTINNIVLIRKSNAEIFNIPDLPDPIYLITQLPQDDQLINIPDAKALLLDQKSIHKTLYINKSIEIISFVNGDVVHYIKSIKAPGLKISEVLVGINNIRGLQPKKIILIDELECLDEKKEIIQLKKIIVTNNLFTPSSSNKKVEREIFGLCNDKPVLIDIRKYGCEKKCLWILLKDLSLDLSDKYLKLFENSKQQMDITNKNSKYNLGINKSYICSMLKILQNSLILYLSCKSLSYFSNDISNFKTDDHKKFFLNFIKDSLFYSSIIVMLVEIKNISNDKVFPLLEDY